MEATTSQQSMLDRKIKELNDTFKEYINEARMGAQMGNYESSKVFYEGIMREIEKLISLTRNDEADGQRKDALLNSLKKLEIELEAVKSLESALEPIKSSLSQQNGFVVSRSNSIQYESVELPVI